MLSMILSKIGAAAESFMIRHERKLVLADVYGNEIMHRYCLFRKEKVEQTIVKGLKWPALYVHRFIMEESPDGPSRHSHVGSTLSLMLRGEYEEQVGDDMKLRKPGSITYLKWNNIHKIVRAKKDTWTLFLRWIAQSDDVRVVPEVCETVCNWCSTNVEGGGCFNAKEGEFNYSTYSRQFNQERDNAFRFPSWFLAGAETDKFLSRRRAAMVRLGRAAPVGVQEQLEVGRRFTKLPIMLAQQRAEKKPEAHIKDHMG